MNVVNIFARMQNPLLGFILLINHVALNITVIAMKNYGKIVEQTGSLALVRQPV